MSFVAARLHTAQNTVQGLPLKLGGSFLLLHLHLVKAVLWGLSPGMSVTLALHRFNTSVQFGLPDEACRAQILQQYAKHLKEEDLAMLAKATPGLAGRDLKDLSEQAERRWASKVSSFPCSRERAVR